MDSDDPAVCMVFDLIVIKNAADRSDSLMQNAPKSDLTWLDECFVRAITASSGLMKRLQTTGYGLLVLYDVAARSCGP